MKRLITICTVLILGFSLSACDDKTIIDPSCLLNQELIDGECFDLVNYYSDDVYHTYVDEVTNMNPFNDISVNSSEMHQYLTDVLYITDFDWDKAIEDGLATEKGDFDTSGAASLPIGRFPQMASSDPVDVNDDGTVWEITLRDDLEFDDGTVIDANTFEFSWKMLLDPYLLNNRAYSLYQETDIPLVNAESYYNQNSYKVDSLGYYIYDISGYEFSTENAFAFNDLSGNGWPMYFLDQNIDLVYTGTDLIPGDNIDESIAYVEDWGDGNFVLEDAYANPFMFTADGTLIAPSEGWELDGVPVGTTSTLDNEDWAYGYNPAYMNDDGIFASVDYNGTPIGGTKISNSEVQWSDVGFEVISTYSFRITLSEAKTVEYIKKNLSNYGYNSIVHEVNYLAGMNDDDTYTNYGTIDNPLVSYGSYSLDDWNANEQISFVRNDDHYSANLFRIKQVEYKIVADQAFAYSDFINETLDTFDAGGENYIDLINDYNIIHNPNSTSFRLAFNLDPFDDNEINPLLQDINFRKAIYYSINREEYSLTRSPHTYPLQGFLGETYISTADNLIAYRSSNYGIDVLADLSPISNGYNPETAKSLFDTAYNTAVANGSIQDGDIVSIELKYYGIETGFNPMLWFKNTIENIFNEGESTQLFRLDLVPLSPTAFDLAKSNGNFEMVLAGWSGVDENAPSFLGQVYNSSGYDMLERGFDTGSTVVQLELKQTKLALLEWISDYETLSSTTEAQDEKYIGWNTMLSLFDGDTLSCTFDELFNFAYSELEMNYTGKTDDFDRITAGMESILLDQMIAIPLFSSTSATAYSDRVIFEINEFNTFIPKNDLRYVYLINEIVND